MGKIYKIPTLISPAHRPLPSKIAIVVLGMARSGTSALTGTLGLLGGELPSDLAQGNSCNPKGYFESRGLIQLNDEILAAAGSSVVDWDPLLPPGWHQTPVMQPYAEKALALLGHIYKDKSLIVFKDPRCCRMFPLYEWALKTLGFDIRIVIPFRNPAEVSGSETYHHGISRTHGYLMWLRHVLDADHFSKKYNHVFVHYADLLNDWQSVIHKIEDGIGVTLPKKSKEDMRKVDRFLDPNLRRQRSDLGDLDVITANMPWVAAAYRALLALRNNPHDDIALQTLNTIRMEFDKACRAFSPMFHPLGIQESREALAKKLDVIYASRSWRITQPLRTINAWLQRRISKS